MPPSEQRSFVALAPDSVERRIAKALENCNSFPDPEKKLCSAAILFRPIKSSRCMQGSVPQRKMLNLVLNMLF